MLKKTLLQISTVVLFVLFAVMMSSCERYDTIEPSVENNSEYTHLYDTEYIKTGINNLNLSVQDLKHMHKSIASIYQVRSELQKDWSKRKQYVLDPEIFTNEYLQKYMTMYLYECVHFLTPEEDQYVENLPYIENITINTVNVFEKNSLFLVPVHIDSRDYWDDGYLEKDEYEQLFVFKRQENELVITNFISGYISDKQDEVFSKISDYTQENRKNSSYNRLPNTLIRNSNNNLNDYLDFIEGDMSKQEYIKKMKK